MVISGNEVQDQIITILGIEATTAHELAGKIGVSLQSIHKTLKKLVKNHVVLKQKTLYILNQEWIANLYIKLGQNQLIQLDEGEKLSYHFTSFEHLERFWKHSLFPLIGYNNQIFIYDPHWIWWYLPDNFESEAEFARSFNKNHCGYFLIGGNDAEDQEIRRQWQHEYLRINLDPDIKIPRKNYHTVIGDLVFTTLIPKVVTDEIDKIYQAGYKGQDLKKRLQPVLTNKVPKIIFKIECNKAKAKKIKKIIGKDFAII